MEMDYVLYMSCPNASHSFSMTTMLRDRHLLSCDLMPRSNHTLLLFHRRIAHLFNTLRYAESDDLFGLALRQRAANVLIYALKGKPY